MYEYVLFKIGSYAITIHVLVIAVLFVVATRAAGFIVSRFLLKPFFRRNNVDVGRSYAVTSIARYVIYIFGIFAGLSALEIQFQAVWAGAAALLVGIGIGLQKTFNDFFCGFLLLVERPVEVGNVIEVDGLIGRIVEIGLRTSKMRTRDDIMIIVPNSQLINLNVTNFSQNRRPLRFGIDLGVAHDSDAEKLVALLEGVARAHADVLERPVPRVMFREFTPSSLFLTLYFYTEENWRIEFIKSDLRFGVLKALAEAGIKIPFPQQDLWVRNGEVLAEAFRQNPVVANSAQDLTDLEAARRPPLKATNRDFPPLNPLHRSDPPAR